LKKRGGERPGSDDGNLELHDLRVDKDDLQHDLDKVPTSYFDVILLAFDIVA